MSSLSSTNSSLPSAAKALGHCREGLARTIGWLLEETSQDKERIAVAIEKPHGAVVELFLDHGIAIFSINPKQVDRFRDRYSMSGAKDDRRDAFVLADSLRTDGHRDLQRQNLLQTVISAATFGGANGMLLPMGLLWLTGRIDLVPVMLLGALAGLVIDATLLYRLFDTKLFPATGLWPSGVATAECMIAGDQGGKRARLLGVGALAGVIGYPLGIPMDVVGVCWIGNIWALFMFGFGLLVRGYSGPVLHVDVNELFVPHGFMVGAGLVALR